MLEQLVERLVLEGKITWEEINGRVEELRAEQPPVVEDIVSLKRRQDETENTLVFILDMTLGGM
ncbi:hypothetical protein [Lysinibacillus sp. SGAir0095]|uniref:hypothetical protein n=1 Tax=Lysinibacillus sp. SGAir0095 TaxID=2070463 RepID=UPI0010CCD335|nr:hypothetical protein [Lysinibacillus sp. SGAir0095]QCR33120.1 hypothetical protein C1N55_13430 [Lysinibacillus sp. SGAir0095]